MKAKATQRFGSGKFFSWLRRTAERKIFGNYHIQQKSKRESVYIGRIMVPVTEKKERDIIAPLTFPLFFIKEEDAWRMFYLASSRSSEVSSLMRVERLPKRVDFSHQIFPRQFCSTVKSDIDFKWLADYSRNLPSEERAVFNCNFWMHSHLSRNGARWSNYDNRSIEKMIQGKKFLISLVVVAQDGTLRYRCRIDFGEPLSLTIDDIPISVVRCRDINHEALKKEMDSEYGEKVVITEDQSSLYLYDKGDGFIFSGDSGLFLGEDTDLKGR